ncbi:TraB/GumN family protein [Bernardetia sp. OM2101]|uniref:TraB/GumN family protein n=1 Tax=Bernardetia sp. OM2101 TaxID=3344876 RepID=UPI0035D07F6C
MNKILKLAFLFLFLTNIACAQNSNEKTLLWRISGNGLSEPSYLYGTIHVPNNKFMNFSDSMKRVLRTVNSIIVEVHETNPFAGLSGMSMEDGKSLKKLLGEKDYAELEKRVKEDSKLASLLPFLDKIKPLIISSQLSMQHAEKNMELPMDFLFGLKAKDRNQKMIGLETTAEQYKSFGDVNMDEQLSMLRHVIYNVEADKEEMEEVTAAYLEQDIDKSASFIATYQEEYPDFVEQIMTKRNIRMIQRTDSLLKLESNRLIAIGAGHLGAEDGFIAVLRQKGYTVEAVMPTYTEEPKVRIDYNPKWVSFKTKDFSCKFPNEKPIQKDPSQERYTLEQTINGNKNAFMVYSQEIKAEGRTREQFYEETKTNIKNSQSSSVLHEIKIDGLDAVETQLNMMGQTMRAIYVINKKLDRVIMIMVVGEEQVIKADFADKFINSFKIK